VCPVVSSLFYHLLFSLCAFVVTAEEQKLCTLLGNTVCACYSTPHCSAKHGCLVGLCNVEACAFPRICFCTENGDGTSNCWPVNSGPCDDCASSSVNATTGFPTTPRKALQWEYDHLNNDQLVDRLLRLGQPVDGERDQQLERLIDWTIKDEEIRYKRSLE